MLALLGLLVLSASAAWLSARWSEFLTLHAGLVIGVTAAALMGLASCARRQAFMLRWDSMHWYCSDPSDEATESGPWRAQVALDWGSFILLRLDSLEAPARGRARWLPVQQRGLQPEWHALRCALHSRRSNPAVPDSAAQAGPN